jgi:hypothetical protein
MSKAVVFLRRDAGLAQGSCALAGTMLTCIGFRDNLCCDNFFCHNISCHERLRYLFDYLIRSVCATFRATAGLRPSSTTSSSCGRTWASRSRTWPTLYGFRGLPWPWTSVTSAACLGRNQRCCSSCARSCPCPMGRRPCPQYQPRCYLPPTARSWTGGGETLPGKFTPRNRGWPGWRCAWPRRGFGSRLCRPCVRPFRLPTPSRTSGSTILWGKQP